MLERYLLRIAIKDKLLFMNLFVVAIAMLLVFLLTVAYQYTSYKNELINDLNAQLSVMESNIGSAVIFNDVAAADEILKSLDRNESVNQVYIQLIDNSIFAKYVAKINSQPQLIVSEQSANGAKRLHLKKPIMVNDQAIGTIYLDANLNKIDERITVFSFALVISILLAMVLARIVSIKLGQYITEPIMYLERLVTEITKHKSYDARSNIASSDEVGALSVGINSMLDTIKVRDDLLVDELQQRRVVEKKLDQLAYFDSLTKLPNRHAFTEAIKENIRQSDDSGECFYLLLMDLDFFKVVNDTHGHESGDLLLDQCGKRIRQILNEQDIVFRIGGDEFAVILKEVKNIHDVEKICHRVNHVIAQPFLINNHHLFIGTSIGVAMYRNANYTESSLIKNADIAMYWAKAAGKNTYKFYSEEIERESYFQQKLATDLQGALANHQIEIFYQPIMVPSTKLVAGFEALIRWRHPQKGLISPNVFIPIAESTGMIVPIGEWVVKSAVMQLKILQEQYRADLFVNINISGRQFLDKRIVRMIEDVIKASNVKPNTINLELTESVLMEDVASTVEILTSIRKLGVGIAVDDFGTGHSSMNYLKQFPVDTIKIDKSFVRGLPHDKVDVAILEAMFALAKSLKLDLVAEGVETIEQLEYLTLKECSKVQGYLFSHPLNLDNVHKFMVQQMEESLTLKLTEN